ncbi:MAG: sugar phosphate isomerase/epimerase [Bacteroidales bacterium]|nr:MAG: sugar phosphate isomerase/epimerase [Bacteroidales bacterium]
MNNTRRQFIKKSIAASAGAALLAKNTTLFASFYKTKPFKISLAEWSLNKALFSGKISNLDFPVFTKKEFGIDGVEYVSTFFKGTGKSYINDLHQITKDNGITNVLIMIDGEGNLGDLYDPVRIQAVERHYKWIDTAKILGCHSIRVNARGQGTEQEVSDAAIDGLGRLAEYGEKAGINVIVENHGGYSSDGKWLSSVISGVNSPYCGTLPDFGNFCLKSEYVEGKWNCVEEYDKYQGMKELMTFAKGVSAKSHNFDENGNETNIDYYKMMQIVKDSGYEGYVGIEYEGNILSEKDGIKATKKLLEKIFDKLEI